jgi:glutathionylspermidine synthase
MQRKVIAPRADWQAVVEHIGLTYHTHETAPYWDESAYYELTASEVDALEAAGNVVHQLCLEAAGKVIEKGWWDRLHIPKEAIPAIERSWEEDRFSVYGRFDFAYTGTGTPKLLEYNADTPTALIEASVAQWFWLQDKFPHADQFNSIHERLIAAWKRLGADFVHFASVRDHPEDEQTVLYLQDTCHQAGARTVRLYMDELGWDEVGQAFVDLAGEPIQFGFKLYPWEWMWAEEFGKCLPNSRTQFIEPEWKMILSNKALLPILWELFAGHPNLLPAFDEPGPLGSTYVKKPKLSREGQNVSIIERGTTVLETGGEYGEEGFVYQALAPIPDYQGNRPVCGVWVVDHEAAGLGIREDSGRVTGNLSRFVPHLFAPGSR